MDISTFFASETEKPLDHLTDPGFCGILRTVACIGDSLASGELESLDAEGNRGYHDYYEISWGQYLARMAGIRVSNFSRGGMTASEYCETFAEKRGFWDPDLAAQAYIVALGVNDLLNQHQQVGSVRDIDLQDWHNNRKTFAGYYAQILQRYREISPKSRIFLVTFPNVCCGTKPPDRATIEAHRALMYDLAAFFPFTYVIDLYRDGPIYDDRFKQTFFLGGHMSSAGYLLTARIFASYIDYIIRHNPDDFKQIGFVGTEYHYEGEKW